MPLLGEMRRRNIFKVSLAYAIVSWLIVQVADVLLPTFSAPQWIMQVLVVVLILLFPIAVLLSWAYELTPEGFKATADVDRTQSITVRTGRKLNHIVILLLSISVIFLVLDNYVFREEVAPDPDVAYRQYIAVLPFQNRSAAEENAAFLADGIHDELLTRLSQISDLRVISRTSVMEYRDTTRNLVEIGEELSVGSILEGGVQRAGDEFRINVQLIDARTDEHIWADTFDRELSAANVFAIQSEIATAIADALEARLSDEEEARVAAVLTEDLAALEAYFAGRRLINERTTESLHESIGQFERAVAIDPAFAAAWAGIAEAWLELPNYDAGVNLQKSRREASSATIRAVMLDPKSPDALAALGWHLLRHNYDWAGAENAFREALQVENRHANALHWYSHLLSWQGKQDDAIAAAELAVAADPRSTLMQTNLNYILLDARRWDDASAVATRILQQDNYASLLGNSWIGYLRAGRGAQAAVMLESWAAKTGRDRRAAARVSALIVRAMNAVVQEDEPVPLDEELIESLQIRSEVPEIFAALGDAERTLNALEEANRTGVGYRSLLSMRINPSYDFIRDDPRFQALLDEVGLGN
jgi:TolB-like protein